MVSGPIASFAVLYSQQFLERNITVDVTPRRIDEANHSYVYSFSFKDKEDLCVTVSRIELPELRSGEVNGNLVRAFLEGSAVPAFRVDPDGVRFYGLYVYSGRTMNVTKTPPASSLFFATPRRTVGQIHLVFSCFGSFFHLRAGRSSVRFR
jgi:hypothetical protein